MRWLQCSAARPAVERDTESLPPAPETRTCIGWLGPELGWGPADRLTWSSLCQTYEDQHSEEEEEEEEEEESEDGEEEDDVTSAESESSEEEEGEHGDPRTGNRQQQLEWDDSTLSY